MTTRTSPSPSRGLSSCCARAHSVQFYEKDEYLISLLREFVREGLAAGDSVVILASKAHLADLRKALKDDVTSIHSDSPLRLVPAEDVLGKLLVDGKITAFEELIPPLLGPERPGAGLRVFGELVALLVDQGNPAAALELEELWNQLCARREFSLLCAYPLGSFSDRRQREVFQRISAAHTSVLPTEQFANVSGSDPELRIIASLQQEARSLRAESAERERVEARLRASESQLRQLMDLMPNAVYTCDREGRITYFNRRAAELWGQTPQLFDPDQKFCGSWRLRRLDGTPLPHSSTPMVAAISEGLSTREGEVVIQRPDGSEVIVSVNIEPLRDPDGAIAGAINVFQDVTARKQSEVALRQKEKELSAFVENATVGLHWVGPDGTILWANRAELEMLGYTREEYIGRHIGEFHADGATARDILERLGRGEKICDRQARMRCKDGSVKHVAIDSSVFWENGKFVHTQCFTRDITQQKRAEELSVRLAAIVHSSVDAIFSTDIEGSITSWNAGAERLYGYSAGEIIGKSVCVIIPPDKLAEDAVTMARVRKGERIGAFETTRLRKDGSIVEVALTVSPLQDSTGAILGASRIARDVTERKRAERRQLALYELVARVNRAGDLSEIFNAAMGAICLCQKTDRASILLKEADGVMRFKAWRGLSAGYRAAVEGHSPWSENDPDPQPVLLPNAEAAGLPPHLADILSREGIRSLAFIPIRFENRLLGKFMLYYREPREFDSEEVLTAQTIASQLAFAIERQTTGEFLEKLVRERTASLREAIAQMEEFSYTVSHDLRAPLRGMHGYTTALIEDFNDALPEPARKYLAKIQENAARLDRMIVDVLTFSRLARAELQMEPVDLGALAHRIVEQYPGMQPPQADIRIEALPEVLGHEPSLTQAISNLLTNAVKFVAPGITPKVRIRAEERGDRVRIWFEDNGIGIEPEVQRRLFKMFERAHPKLPYDGTGVGLAIVRKAMERVGGAAGVESDGKNGSRFWIEAKPSPRAPIS